MDTQKEKTTQQNTGSNGARRRERPPRTPKETWADVVPVREHLAALHDGGMTMQAIADAAGCSINTVHRVLTAKATRMRTAPAERLMKVRHQHTWNERERHSAWPSRRRIGALMRIGWPQQIIAEEAGILDNRVNTIFLGRVSTVTAADAIGIQVAYEALSTRPGPRDIARLRARSLEFPPPQAWRSEELDDLEPTVIERVRARWRQQEQPTPGERLWDLLEAEGYTVAEIAKAVGTTPTAVSNWVGDRSSPRSGMRAKLAEVLGADLSFLPLPPASRGNAREDGGDEAGGPAT